jgi:ribosomal protein S18 acetylase RimI-like enzyme
VSSEAASPLDRGDERQAIATVVSAFAADPVERWLYPADEDYERHFQDFVGALGGRAFEHETAWALDGHSAVAFWLAPGIEPDENAVVGVLSESVAEEKHEEMFAVLGQLGEAHPVDPHWYLPWLAVEPDRQSAGSGGRLLAHCLAIVDESGLPAFLETPNPRNVGFYERHRFEVTAVTRSASCPPLTSMLRAGAGAHPSR